MITYEEFIELFKKENEDAVVPVVRESGIQMVACADNNPCEVCSQAEYNKLCTDAQNCTALTYHTMSKMSSMVGAFFSKGDAE